MNILNTEYDNAMRNAVPNEIYDADSVNLHLIGIGMDNECSDAVFDAQIASDYAAQSVSALGFVL